MKTQNVKRVETLVIGGGQAGLSVGYHLAKRGMPFQIVDANEQVGDAWRQRWESLFRDYRDVNGLQFAFEIDHRDEKCRRPGAR